MKVAQSVVSQTADYAAWVALVLILLPLVPRVLAIVTRGRGVEARNTVTGFQALFAAQEKMLAHCQAEIVSLRRELQEAREKHQREVGEWTVRMETIQTEMNHYRTRVEYLERLLTRRGDME